MFLSFIWKVVHPVSDLTQPCLTSVKLMELAGKLDHSLPVQFLEPSQFLIGPTCKYPESSWTTTPLNNPCRRKGVPSTFTILACHHCGCDALCRSQKMSDVATDDLTLARFLAVLSSLFQVTWADLVFLDLSDRVLEVCSTCLDQTPLLKALVDRVKELPRIKKHIETRPERPV